VFTLKRASHTKKTTDLVCPASPTHTSAASVNGISLQAPILELATLGPPPTRDDMAILLVHFNPFAQHSLLRNYLFIANALAVSGVPFYTLEARFANSTRLAPAFNIFSVQARSCLFQKERFIMWLFERLPSRFTKVLPLDADVVLYSNTRQHWYDIISEALDNLDVIQPFGCACKLNHQLAQVLGCKRTIVAAHSKQTIDSQLFNYHPGYAWAFRREWLSRVGGLFDLAIIGGGDTLLAAALLQSNFSSNAHQLKEAYAAEYGAFYSRVGASHPRVGMAKKIVALHLYHGTDVNRHYEVRHTLLDNVNLSSVILTNKDGVFETKADQEGRSFNASMCSYLSGRHDDS
jgi:hypothetical protein